MEALTTRLDEKSALIKHYLKSWANCILEIGKELKEIKENKIFKEKFSSFEEYITSSFGFSDAYAYHFINIYSKYGQNVKRFDTMKDYGMQLLINSLAVPDEHFDEMVEEIESTRKIGLNVEEQVKVVKRFSKQSGEPPRHSDSKEEFALKLKREGNNWKIRWENYLNNDRIVRSEFKEGIAKWLKSAEKFKELENLKKEINEILKLFH